MKKWIVDHPYVITSFVFILVVYAGDRYLNWQEEYYAFILLLYFIVTLGIRLDNISKQIGGTNDHLAKISVDSARVSQQIGEIHSSLLSLNEALSDISEHTGNKKK